LLAKQVRALARARAALTRGGARSRCPGSRPALSSRLRLFGRRPTACSPGTPSPGCRGEFCARKAGSLCPAEARGSQTAAAHRSPRCGVSCACTGSALFRRSAGSLHGRRTPVSAAANGCRTVLAGRLIGARVRHGVRVDAERRSTATRSGASARQPATDAGGPAAPPPTEGAEHAGRRPTQRVPAAGSEARTRCGATVMGTCSTAPLEMRSWQLALS